MATGSNSAKKGSEDVKRKAELSPEFEKSQPRLRRRGSLPDLQEALDPKKSFSLPELMKKGFLDPDIMKDIVPTIMNGLQPQIEKTIRLTIETSLSSTITTAVNNAVDKFKSEVMEPVLKQKDVEITLLKDDIRNKNNRLCALETKVNKLEKSLNDLDQYGRRQSIRLNNVRLPDESNCETVVLDILNKILPADQKISGDEIERCHPVGKPNKKSNRQIVVKFLSYKTKAKVYEARFKLSNIYMTEDLTKDNQVITTSLLKMKKAKKIHKFWSIDGKIYAKTHVLQTKRRILTISDIDEMIEDAIQQGFVLGSSEEENTLTEVFSPMD